MMDDLTLPAEYHIAVLDLNDAILATLAQVKISGAPTCTCKIVVAGCRRLVAYIPSIPNSSSILDIRPARRHCSHFI
jgi:hypothetical protein